MGGGYFLVLGFFYVEEAFLKLIFIHGNSPLTCGFKLVAPGDFSHDWPNFISGKALLKIFIIISCFFFLNKLNQIDLFC